VKPDHNEPQMAIRHTLLFLAADAGRMLAAAGQEVHRGAHRGGPRILAVLLALPPLVSANSAALPSNTTALLSPPFDARPFAMLGGFLCGFFFVLTGGLFSKCVDAKKQRDQRANREECAAFVGSCCGGVLFILVELGILAVFAFFVSGRLLGVRNWRTPYVVPTIVLGGMGDLVGFYAYRLIVNKTTILKRCCGEADAPSASAPSAPPPEEQQPAHEPHGEPAPPRVEQATVTSSSAAGVELHEVVVAREPLPIEGAAAPPPPILREIGQILTRELGLQSGATLAETIDSACGMLGVPREGSLLERGQACWRVMRNPPA
jgi:hypothetical protein